MFSPPSGPRAPFRSLPVVLPSAALLAMLLLAGCSAPAPLALSAADPAATAGPVAYRPVTAGYQSRRPVEPRPWREQNDRVAPR